MNILIVAGRMDMGGAETHIYELIRALRLSGHKITLACAGGKVAARIASMGERVRVKILPLDKKDAISVIKSVRGLSRLARSELYDIVHSHTRIAALCVRLACRGVRTVSTVHASFLYSHGRRALTVWGRNAIAVSEDIASQLKKEFPRLYVRVIPNGIDTDRFVPVPRDDGKFRVTFISRLDADCSRGADALLRIAPTLAERIADLEIVICGGGEELDRISNLAKIQNERMGKKTVNVLGRCERVERVLARSDAVVAVSRAALEAMSCAIPVVLCGNEGYGGVVTSKSLSTFEKTNFCARGGDMIDDRRLTDDILSIYSMSRSDRHAHALKCREYVIAHHSAVGMAAQTERFYRDILSAPARLHVLLCGYYGFGNMGDDRMLVCAAERARLAFGSSVRLSALTRGGKAVVGVYGVDFVNRLRPRKYIAQSDIVIFGGGTLLQNVTSNRSLAYYLHLLTLARKMGVRTELWGNGIGRIRGDAQIERTARALSSCAYIGVRDRESEAWIRHVLSARGHKAPPIKVEPDLTYRSVRADAATARALLYRLGIGHGTEYAVIALKGGDKKAHLASALRQIREYRARGLQTVFVAMYPDEDLDINRRICARFGGVLAYPVDYEQTVSLIGGSREVLSGRYHALLFAKALGKSFVGIGNGEKILRLCGENNAIRCDGSSD